MGSGMGAPDDEMNRREELRDKRLKEMSEQNVVGGSNPDTGGKVSTTDVSAADMLDEHGTTTRKNETMTTETKEVISPRYGNVQKYSIEDLDMDTLRDEVFPALDMTESEKQAAGALVTHSGRGLTHSDLAQKAGVSQSTVSRTKRAIEGRGDNPTDKQKSVLRYARMNPEASLKEISKESTYATSNIKMLLRAFRHHPLKISVSENVEHWGDFDSDGDEDEQSQEENKQESTDADAVQKDLDGDEDVEYKYDPKDKSKRQTRGGQSLKKVSDQKHLVSLFRELDQRVRELEDSGAEVDVPDEVKGRISSLESQVDATQSVLDRVENQQANLERFVEDEMDTDSDFTEIREDLEAIRDMAFPEDADEEQFKKTPLGQHLLQIADRVDRIEESLTSHKEALQSIRDSDDGSTSSSDFSTEEKRRMVVALAEKGGDELIDRVLDDL